MTCKPRKNNGLLTDIFHNRVMVSCAQSALTGAERYNKEQTWKRPIKVTVNVTLRFCRPEELPLKAINHVQIYENAKPKVHAHAQDMFHQRSSTLMKPYNPLHGIWRWGMLLQNMQKQKNHRKPKEHQQPTCKTEHAGTHAKADFDMPPDQI